MHSFISCARFPPLKNKNFPGKVMTNEYVEFCSAMSEGDPYGGRGWQEDEQRLGKKE
jgi:hypothetical protein